MSLPTVEVMRDAERAVVGACLIDQDAPRRASKIVTHADFADPRLGELFDVIATMREAGQPIDAQSVRGTAVEIGMHWVDGVVLHDLIQATPTAANVEFYARQVFDGAVRRRLWAFGRRTQQLAEAGTSVSEAMGAVRGEWDAMSGLGSGQLESKPLGDLLAGEDTYDWLVPNLLERRDRLVLTGIEGAGKSMMIRQIAICAAAGVHPTTFQPIEPIRVLVVDAENTEKQWRRKSRALVAKARSVGSADPAATVQIAAVDTMPSGRLDLTSERDIGAVHRLIDQHKPDLLVIGPLYKLTPRAINNDDDAAPVITALDGLRARDVALVIEAHAGHAMGADGQRDVRPRGSAALLGWPEFGMGLRVDRDAMMPGEQHPSVFQLVRWRGDRDERAWPARLVRGGAWPWVDDMNRPPSREVRDWVDGRD